MTAPPLPGCDALVTVHAPSSRRRGVLLGDVARRIGNEGERISTGDHGGAEIDAVGSADRRDFVVELAHPRRAADLFRTDQLAQIIACRAPGGPAVGADLSKFGRVDAVQS